MTETSLFRVAKGKTESEKPEELGPLEMANVDGDSGVILNNAISQLALMELLPGIKLVSSGCLHFC